MRITNIKGTLIILSVLTLGEAFCQKSVGIGTLTPNANAILDLVVDGSNPQGFLPPRLTTAQMTTLASVLTSPKDDGMLSFDTDMELLHYWKNDSWVPVSAAASGTDAKSLQGNPVSVVVPLTGQSLVWTGTAWTPTTVGVVPILVTSYYSIPAASFDTQTDGNETIIGTDGTEISLKGRGTMYAAINLPHEAIITEITVYASDTDPAEDITMVVYRKNLVNSTIQVVASGASIGAIGSNSYILALIGGFAEIRNDIYSYYIKIEMERDLFIRGVRITYTE